MHRIDQRVASRYCVVGGHCVMLLNAMRIHDLIAKTAHVSLKSALRTLLALRAVATGVILTADDILAMPYQASRPSGDASMQCQEAYLWLYDVEEVAGTLYEIEQLR